MERLHGPKLICTSFYRSEDTWLAAYRDQFPSGGTLELRADCSLLHWVAGLHADYQPPEIVSAVDMALDAEEIIEAVSAEFKQRIAALSEIWVKNARGRNA